MYFLVPYSQARSMTPEPQPYSSFIIMRGMDCESLNTFFTCTTIFIRWVGMWKMCKIPTVHVFVDIKKTVG